jgi:hypothetical protein
MKVRQIEWPADFIFWFVFWVAVTALLKLHTAGQPLLGIVFEAIVAAAFFSLFNYIRKPGDD